MAGQKNVKAPWWCPHTGKKNVQCGCRAQIWPKPKYGSISRHSRSVRTWMAGSTVPQECCRILSVPKWVFTSSELQIAALLPPLLNLVIWVKSAPSMGCHSNLDQHVFHCLNLSVAIKWDNGDCCRHCCVVACRVWLLDFAAPSSPYSVQIQPAYSLSRYPRIPVDILCF